MNKFWIENKRNLHTLKEYIRFYFSNAGEWNFYTVVIPTWLIKLKYRKELTRLESQTKEEKV
jgi:hypothetical protein